MNRSHCLFLALAALAVVAAACRAQETTVLYSRGRQIRAYTRSFVEHVAKTRRLAPVPFWI